MAPREPPIPVLTLSGDHVPSVWPGPRGLAPRNRNRQKWWATTSRSGYKRWVPLSLVPLIHSLWPLFPSSHLFLDADSVTQSCVTLDLTWTIQDHLHSSRSLIQSHLRPLCPVKRRIPRLGAWTSWGHLILPATLDWTFNAPYDLPLLLSEHTPTTPTHSLHSGSMELFLCLRYFFKVFPNLGTLDLSSFCLEYSVFRSLRLTLCHSGLS